MIQQYFVLGRNPKLSRQEIISYLNARSQKFKEIFFEENYILIQLEKEIDINQLGGTIKSGIIESSGTEETVENFILADEIIPKDKFSYGVFGNVDPEPIKQKFKSEKRKTTLRHGNKKIRFQENKTTNLPKADHYLILHQNKDNLYFGKINQEYNSKETEYRDMKKPERREHLAISPRLAKILINLSQVKENDTLLDPFCGIGGIMQEALIKNINAYGSDIDKHAIFYARKNLDWIQKRYQTKSLYTTKTQNAKSIPNKEFDGIATETPLGEVLKKQPNDQKAQQIIQNFERFIIPILKHLKRTKKKNGKIAITFPKIRKFAVDYDQITKETNLRIHVNPIEESRPNQNISRDIVVFK